MSKKVCIFDIDNTLTHGQKATRKSCCINGKNCMVDNVQPAWPTSNSGTTTYVQDAIKNCKKNGYEVAIATAESGNESINSQQKKFIKSLFPNSIIYNTPLYQNSCTAQGYNGSCSGPGPGPACCNNEYKDKTNMYINIMNHLKIDPVDYNKSIVFDDDTSNLATAEGLGFNTCQASQKCGGSYCDNGCGVTRSCSELPNFL